MKRKYINLFLSVTLSLILAYCVIWTTVTCIIIPKIIVPKLKEYINNNFTSPVKLSIGKIYFHPFKGFLLDDLTLSAPAASKDNIILKAQSVDIDLALLPLLRNKVEIKKFEMRDFNLNIERNTDGIWNFTPLLNLDIFNETGNDNIDFVIDKIGFGRGQIHFSDFKEKNNTLDHIFTNAGLNITSPERNLYQLDISSCAKNKKDESITLKLNYNKKDKSLEAQIEINTIHLGDYFNYYLHDILSPWKLKAEACVVTAQLSYKDDKEKSLIINGDCTINNATLAYGSTVIKGSAKVKQGLKFVNGKISEDVSHAEVSLENGSISEGEYTFVEKAFCNAAITNKMVDIRNVSGIFKNRPVNVSGTFNFASPEELNLTGTLGKLKNNLSLKVLPDNKAVMDWNMDISGSYIKLHAEIDDLENLLFNSTVDGKIDLPGLFQSDNTAAEDNPNITGTINISGIISRKTTDLTLSSIRAELKTSVQDFSILGLAPVAFNFDMYTKDDILWGEIQKTELYRGVLHGTTMINPDKWGIELHVDGFNMEEFAKIYPEKLKGIKGIFNGNISVLNRWDNFNALTGGGYFKLTDCYLWEAPVFSQTETAVKSVTKGVTMPDFNDFEGNFEITDKACSIENVFCDASGINLNIKGKTDYSGKADFTAGVTLSTGGIFRTLRQIAAPVTIAIDFAVNCIKIQIYGTWSNLDYKVGLQPSAIITAIFPAGNNQGIPDKYTLQKLWFPAVKKTTKKTPARIKHR